MIWDFVCVCVFFVLFFRLLFIVFSFIVYCLEAWMGKKRKERKERALGVDKLKETNSNITWPIEDPEIPTYIYV